MKRSTKMILLLMLAAALACCYLAVQNFSIKETVQTETTDYPLLSEGDAAGIRWNAGGEEIALRLTDGVWKLEEDGAFPVDQKKAADIAEEICDLTATRQLTGVESLEDYGLAEPLFSVTVDMADGTQTVIYQGSENSLSGQTYVQVSGDDSVYLVDDAPSDILDADRDDLIAMESVAEIGDVMTIEMSSHNTLHTIRYASGDRYYDPETDRTMDAQAVSDFIDLLTGIEWTGVASYSATADDKENWLLTDPVAKVVVSSTVEETLEDGSADIQVVEYTLIIGNETEDGESVYAMIDPDSTMVYTLGTDDAYAVFDALKGGLESTQVISVNWDELTGLSLICGDKTVTAEKVAVEASDDTEDSDAEAAEQWQVGGVAVDGEKWSRVQTMIDEMEFTETDDISDAAEYAVLRFETADGTAVTLTFLDASAEAYAIAGEAKSVPASEIDELLRLLRHLI